MTKVAVLLTTFNRAAETVKCIKSIYENNTDIDFRFVVTDDASTDDTVAMIKSLPIKLKVLSGDGKLFWNGGMRRSMAYALNNAQKFDYVLLINDDVVFYENAINKIIERLDLSGADVIVGATSDDDNNMSYGGVIKKSKLFAKFDLLKPSEAYEQCDTFNCNCVLMSNEVFKEVGNLDEKYTHSMGDYDYGMHIRKLGKSIISSSEFVGHCNDNDDSGTWRDISLPRRKRLQLKEGPKGLPFSDWFHFVNKNYGFLSAIYHSTTPYIRILLKK